MTSPTLSGPARSFALAMHTTTRDGPRRTLTTSEAAAYTGIAASTLEKKRVSGGGPLYLKLGRSVRYRITDLDAYLDGRACSSTSEYTLH